MPGKADSPFKNPWRKRSGFREPSASGAALCWRAVSLWLILSEQTVTPCPPWPSDKQGVSSACEIHTILLLTDHYKSRTVLLLLLFCFKSKEILPNRDRALRAFVQGDSVWNGSDHFNIYKHYEITSEMYTSQKFGHTWLHSQQQQKNITIYAGSLNVCRPIKAAFI